MINIKKILAGMTIASFVLASSFAYAENDAQVKAAIDQTVAKLEQAVDAVNKGEDAKTIADLVLEAKQLQKSFSTSDSKVAVKKAQGSNLLGQARTALSEGDMSKGGELVKKALATYQEVKEKYNAAH